MQDLETVLIELAKAEPEVAGMSPEELANTWISEYRLTEFVPNGAKVFCALNMGQMLLLSNGILVIDTNPMTRKIKGTQIVAFRDIRGVRVKKAGRTGGIDFYSVIVDRDDPSASNFGFKSAPFVMGITSSQEHALVFQRLLGDMMNGSPGEVSSGTTESPLDKLVKLKALLDSGVISQEEFDAKKSSLMDQI